MARERRWATTFSVAGVTEDPPMWRQLIPPADSVAGVTVVRVLGSLVINSDNVSNSLSQHVVRAGIFVGPTPDGSEIGTGALDTTDWLWFGSDTLFDVGIGGLALQATDPASQFRTMSSRAARRLETGESVWCIWAQHGAPATDWLGALFSFRTLYLLPA